MPIVKMPDGTQVSFPDDMPREQIKGMIEKKFPELAQAPASTENRDALSRTRTVSGGMLEGIPVVGPMIRGGVERAAAATLAPFSDQSYGDILQTIQKGSEDEKTANPWLDTGSQIAGGIGGTIPMVMAAPAWFGASSAPIVGRTLASTTTGAALGGMDAAVRSQGDAPSTLKGVSWGAGLGMAGPLAGQAIGKGVSAITSRFGQGRGTGAERAFTRAAGADGAENMQTQLSAMGPDAMPMDLGPNLQRQAGGLAALPGDAQQTIRSAVANRQTGAGERVARSLDTSLGQPVNTLAVADDIIAKRSAASKPLYDAAYAKPVDFTKEMEDLLKRPSVGRALSKAKGMAADEGLSSRQWFANVADDGTVNIVNTPDVRQLDLTKRALDDMISSAQRGGNNNEARILTQAKNNLVDMVDKNVPEYKAARQAFSGPSGVLDAMEEGQKAFANSMTPNQLRTRVMQMGSAEKEAFVQGARAQIANIMGTARNDALAARSTFQKGYNKEKLEMLVGKGQAEALLKSLDAEAAFTRTRDVVTGNSETAARSAAMGEIQGGNSGSDGFVKNLLNMRFGDAAGDVGQKAVGGLRDASQQRMNQQLAQLLTSRDPKSITRAINIVQAAQRRGDISAQRAKEITQSMMIGGSQERRPLEITVGRPKN